jgi:preprotein translocase subunit YajC
MQQAIGFLIFVVLLGVYLFWMQRRARSRYEKRIEGLSVGDRVVTIGGIYGRLLDLDRDAERAQLQVAPDVVLQIGLRAISHAVEPETATEGEEEV